MPQRIDPLMGPRSSRRTTSVKRILPLLLVLSGFPQIGQAKETLLWLLRDLPPTTIFEGPQKDQGVVDQILPALFASLPEYEHTIVHVNRARGIQMLRDSPFACDPSLMLTPQRAQWLAFSKISFRAFSNGVAALRQDHASLQPFIQDGRLDLAALLASGPRSVGVVAERSYGDQIDSLLTKAPSDALTAHYGNSAIGNLLQMQRLGRLKTLIGYQPEIRFQAQQQGIDPSSLEFYPIIGVQKYQAVHVGCSNTAQGRHAIERINQTLLQLRQNRLIELYAAWLEPPIREEYRKDALALFRENPEQ